ncbi:MAG TPA: indolepyruvate ferredoxin oxidoreductase subunit alpha [Spirochaetia bacterium]|nr:indolepyruvate ferredoxin oxidoreductase subunit alpha [Spirochaetia bacterium]
MSQLTAARSLLSGNEAIARGAWEAGVTVATGYPGTPSTEILEAVRAYKDDIYCEWSPNEKVALEVAAGASLAGARAIVTMKHVGLNVAADPLMTLAYIGTVGGLVIVVADDPGMHSSQNEQDTRHYARFARIPILEPSDSQEARDFLALGLELSERFSTPIILRSTTRVSHSSGAVVLGERGAAPVIKGFQKDPQRFVPVPMNARPMRVRVEERTAALKAEVNRSPANRIEWGDRDLGIIAEGIAYQYVRELAPNASVLKIGWVWPFPDELIREFAAGVRRLLVVEELDDILEEHIRALGIPCEGRRSGPWAPREAVPGIGELSSDRLAAVLGAPLASSPAGAAAEPVQPPARPPVLCPACPHRGIFYALGKFNVAVTGDIGCYSLGVLPPLKRIDTILCMGGGVSMAHGMQVAESRRPAPAPGEPARQKIVGMVGDSTFFHSGITGLLDIVYNKGAAVVIVVDNRTTAMTGHQEHPGTGRTLMGEPTISASVEEFGRACGMKNIATVDPYDLKPTIETLRQALESDEPWLIVSRSPCPLYTREAVGPARQVDQELCRKCKLCLKLGCPAIEYVNDEIHVNETLCGGCALCEKVCKDGAFKLAKGACNE